MQLGCGMEKKKSCVYDLWFQYYYEKRDSE